MSSGLKILFITPEVFPFAKVGGLADVLGALPRHVASLGHDVKVICPCYASIDKKKFSFKNYGKPFYVPLGSSEKKCKVLAAQLENDEVTYCFLDNKELFGLDGVYGPDNSTAFENNIQRFTLLCRSVFPFCRQTSWIPDIIHAHDWTAALSAVYLNLLEKVRPFLKTKSVLTIHNVGYQGVFPKSEFHWTQFAMEDFYRAGFEFHDKMNLLKAGIANAHSVTTVSPTYASEIQTERYGCGLDDVLRERGKSFCGILNGIDYQYWNPEFNRRIPAQYSAEDLSGKTMCKRELQKQMGLPVEKQVPLVGMVSRLVKHKGFRELCGPGYGSLYSICRDMPLQWVILGRGEEWCEKELTRLAGILPNLKIALKFEERLAHRIEAGADFFFMPSQYEPCGLNQMYSLRFGTLPIVRNTGGLADTVENYDEETGGGTGFVFDDLTPKTLHDVMAMVLRIYHEHPDHLRKMRIRAMNKRFEWDEAARKYEKVYQSILH
ncbi:MAG: glycogen synthase [Spirochaetales bacterium]|nr:glycogen synthase [Spirochaetales bacterium]